MISHTEIQDAGRPIAAHGAAVAYAAHHLGHRAEIFVPAITPANKVILQRLERMLTAKTQRLIANC